MPLPLLAAIGLGLGAAASVAGSVISSNAAKSASATQAKTAQANKALAEQYTGASLDDLNKSLDAANAEFDKGAGAISPYAKAGEGALSKISDIYGLNGAEGSSRALSEFTTSPGYQFRLSQGVQALDRSANARSGLYSGAQGKALTDYGQGAASAEWGNYVNGLSGIMGSGQNAANSLTNISGSRANALLGNARDKATVRQGGLSAITNASSQAGAAQAAGTINSANAWSSGLNNLTSLAMFGAGKWA